MAQDDINDLYAQIKTYISQHGPSLTVDIASAIGKDTMQTGAILDYFVARGTLQRTNRKYGFSSVYFLPDQKDAALSKLYETLNNAEKAIVNKFKEEKVIKSDDLLPAERYMIQNLSDFVRKLSAIDRDTNEKKDIFVYYNVPNETVQSIINKEEKPVQTAVKIQKTKAPKVSSDELSLIVSNGFSSPSSIDKHTFIAKYGQHGLNVIVGVFQKKKPTKNDLAKIAGYASKNRTVAFVLTHFPAYNTEYGNAINFVKI